MPTNCATYDDVNLILRLYELRREEKMRQARQWFAVSFHPKSWEEVNELCPLGSDESAYFRMVVSYWDQAAACVVHGTIDTAMFQAMCGEMLASFCKIEHLLPGIREKFI